MSLISEIVYKAFGHLAKNEIVSLESDVEDIALCQERKLKEIIKLNSQTIFGKNHSFASINSIEDYCNSVEISDYENYRTYIERMFLGENNVLTAEKPFMFATTSGTSAEPKYIPVTKSYIKEFRHASVASGYFTLKNFPAISKGVTLSIFSPAVEGYSSAGVPYGAISGGLYLQEPYLVKQYIAPIPYEAYCIKDYESRYYAILRAALVLPISCIYTLNPSTIVMLLKRLEKYAPQLIKDIAEGTWSGPAELTYEQKEALKPFLRPNLNRARELDHLLHKNRLIPPAIWHNLQVVCCWTKASAAFYIKEFPRYFENIPIIDITYGASEGRGTISLGDGRQLLAIRSHFFEFIPEAEIKDKSPTVLTACDLEIEKNYYILFSTSAGLYRYHINDVIKVVGFYKNCPLIEFQYKGGNISSFTGEKITELQVTEAMRLSLEKMGLSCRFFTVLPRFLPEPHYSLLFEPEVNSLKNDELSNLLICFEEYLSRLNIEYKAKRESARLAEPELHLLRTGTYEALRKELTKSGIADAQIKISHLNPKDEVKKFFEKSILAETKI